MAFLQNKMLYAIVNKICMKGQANMSNRDFPKIIINERAEAAVKRGHPWIFSEKIIDVEGEYQNGDLVDVYSRKHRFLGTGFINDNSAMRVRLISRNSNDKFDEDFFRRRIRYAIEYRKIVMKDDFNCCRIIFGEADSFPGLTVDKFDNVLVVQVLSLGIERIKNMIFLLLIEVFSEYGINIRSILERNDVAIREKEGMSQYKAFYKYPGLTEIPDGKLLISENGIKYEVDILNGQKTGFFLDQKYNRIAAARIAEGRNVLDCFTHTGAFALNAAAHGAKHVTAVDISEEAIYLTKKNAELNNLTEKMSFICIDVFDLLTELEAKKKCIYDYIILDPPAFTKSRETVRNAFNGYKAINAKAMKLLPRGGYLATCSCSHFMSDVLFKQMLQEAAYDASVSLRQIEARQQAPDHPILWNVEETNYLKFYIFQVI